MSDFGLNDKIISEKLRYSALIWHGLLDRTPFPIYNNSGEGTGNPETTSMFVFVIPRDGMVSDSGVAPLNPVT